MTHLRPAIALSAATVAVLLVGCGGSKNNVLAPQFQPEVVNAIDNFQFQVTGVTGVTQVIVYSWRNTGVQANVDQSCSITSGSATISVRDSTGALLHARNLADNGSFATTPGLAGTWTVRIDLSGVRGNLNFRLQKKT